MLLSALKTSCSVQQVEQHIDTTLMAKKCNVCVVELKRYSGAEVLQSHRQREKGREANIHKSLADSPVPFRAFPSALRQARSGLGTPMVPQRSSTLFPTALRTCATAVWTRGAWHLRSSASLNRTPDRLSGAAQRRRVSINATENVGNFWNWTRSYRRQSHSQGLSWRPGWFKVNSLNHMAK